MEGNEEQARAKSLEKKNQSCATEQTRKPLILREEKQRKTNNPTNQNTSQENHRD